MTPGVVALGVGMVLLGATVTVIVWGGPHRLERLLGRTGLVAILGGAAVGLIVMGLWALASSG